MFLVARLERSVAMILTKFEKKAVVKFCPLFVIILWWFTRIYNWGSRRVVAIKQQQIIKLSKTFFFCLYTVVHMNKQG